MFNNMKLRLSIALSIFILLPLASFGEEENIDNGLSKLNSIISLSKRSYIKELNNNKIFEATYRGLFDSLDLDSAYYNPKEFSAFINQFKSLTTGVGITIENQAEGTLITSVSKGSSAYEMGVMPGDFITYIKGSDLKGKDEIEINSLLRGYEWESISIQTRRTGLENEITYDLPCRKLLPNQITYEAVNHIGYIKIFQFTESNIIYFEEALDFLLKEEKVEGLIIDVRDNFGGELDATAHIMDKFIPKDKKLMILDYRIKEDEELISREEKVEIPLVILVNERSVGSAEIFAGAIREASSVAVIGKQTLGDGKLQWIVPLQDGSGIKLTIGMILTPNMKQIDKVGIHPTYRVENKNMEINRVENLFSPMNSIKHSVVGMKDRDTLGAQERLNYLGYTTVESGYFNRDTELEIAKFQLDNGLLNSGILNWETKAKLDEAVRKKASGVIDDLQKEKALLVMTELIKK